MTRKKTARVAAPNNNATIPTIIEFLLDETGSMQSCKGPTIGGFNEFLAEQRQQSGLCLLTLTKFDTTGLKTPYVDMPIGFVPELTEDTFVPGASTNLRDAIGWRMSELEKRTRQWTTKPNALFVVMTDGGDNASRQYSEIDVRSMVSKYQPEGWTFVYLGADQNALEIAERLGFPAGNTKSFASAEMKQTMQTLSRATTAYRAARADAVVTDNNFFANAR